VESRTSVSDDPETTPADDEPQAEDAPTPEEFEEDPARNPDDEGLKNIKGG
jgi:hypothetical protein